MEISGLIIGAAVLVVGLLVGLPLGWALARAGSGRTVGPGGAGGSPADLAALLAPASDALVRVEDRLNQVEKERAGAYAGLREQVAALHRSSAELGAHTQALVGALRAPQVRGRWGELQLQRIVELAGMVEHCDFDIQVSAGAGAVRPDMIVRLSGGRQIPVDAKVPFAAWLEAVDCPDDAGRRRLLHQHARATRAHVDALAGKAYWSYFQPAPEFVVMFVPGESLLDAALSVDPGLADHAFSRGVVIATPTSLIALLRTVAFTWRQERLSASAAEIRALGQELHGRLATLGGHLDRMGGGLSRALESYNEAVGSVESRVMVSARRFADLGVTADPLPPLHQVQGAPRRPRSDVFLPDDPPSTPANRGWEVTVDR